MLLTGNHNYKKPTFDLVVRTIILEDGSWIGAHAIVCPGVVCGQNSILAVKFLATHRMKKYHSIRATLQFLSAKELLQHKK